MTTGPPLPPRPLGPSAYHALYALEFSADGSAIAVTRGYRRRWTGFGVFGDESGGAGRTWKWSPSKAARPAACWAGPRRSVCRVLSPDGRSIAARFGRGDPIYDVSPAGRASPNPALPKRPAPEWSPMKTARRIAALVVVLTGLGAAAWSFRPTEDHPPRLVVDFSSHWNPLGFTHDGSAFVTWNQEGISFWDARNGRLKSRWKERTRRFSRRFSPDGRSVLVVALVLPGKTNHFSLIAPATVTSWPNGTTNRTGHATHLQPRRGDAAFRPAVGEREVARGRRPGREGRPAAVAPDDPYARQPGFIEHDRRRAAPDGLRRGHRHSPGDRFADGRLVASIPVGKPGWWVRLPSRPTARHWAPAPLTGRSPFWECPWQGHGVRAQALRGLSLSCHWPSRPTARPSPRVPYQPARGGFRSLLRGLGVGRSGWGRNQVVAVIDRTTGRVSDEPEPGELRRFFLGWQSPID